MITTIPKGTDVWVTVPASPPLRMTIRARLNDRCEECRLPVYRCESIIPASSRSWHRKVSGNGNSRSAEIPGIMHMAVEPLPSMHPNGEIWGAMGHPFSPDRLAFGVGSQSSTFGDHGMRWDNSGKNGLYALINWSN